MPIHDCKCVECNKIEEVIIGINDDVPVCPKCGSERTKLCNCSHFELKYNPKTDICSWGNEGYAATQRYRYVNKSNINE